MGSINSIKQDKFEQLLDEGYGATSIACFFGVTTNTLCTWTKRVYGKTAKQIYLEKMEGRTYNGKTKSRN